jgi:TolB protein
MRIGVLGSGMAALSRVGNRVCSTHQEHVMSRRRSVVVLAMVCAASSLAVVVPVAVQAAPRATVAVRFGRIVFQSNRGGHPEIYIMNPNGGGLTQLTNFKEERGNREPSITPDGRKIAFYSNRFGYPEIFTMQADGSNERPVGKGVSPSFSYDGHRIVFVVHSLGGVSNIWVMNALGGTPTELTHATRPDEQADQPQFSPDGKKIVFVRRVGAFKEIFVMDADGSHIQRLTHTEMEGVAIGSSVDPTFSPNGKEIIFASDRQPENGEDAIYAMNASDGKNVVKLSHDGFSDLDPAFSTSGVEIVFVSRRHGTAELFRMNRDGSHEVQLTHPPKGKADVFPSWGF